MLTPAGPIPLHESQHTRVTHARPKWHATPRIRHRASQSTSRQASARTGVITACAQHWHERVSFVCCTARLQTYSGSLYARILASVPWVSNWHELGAHALGRWGVALVSVTAYAALFAAPPVLHLTAAKALQQVRAHTQSLNAHASHFAPLHTCLRARRKMQRLYHPRPLERVVYLLERACVCVCVCARVCVSHSQVLPTNEQPSLFIASFLVTAVVLPLAQLRHLGRVRVWRSTQKLRRSCDTHTHTHTQLLCRLHVCVHISLQGT